MKKLLILLCFIFSLVFTRCNNSEVERSTYVDRDTKTMTTSNDLEDSHNSDDNLDFNSKDFDCNSDENLDKNLDEAPYNNVRTKDYELGDLADILASQVLSDFKVTYQYETGNMTGYIFFLRGWEQLTQVDWN